LYLSAYGKIYRNAGATTQGTTEETVDTMSLTKIDAIINVLRQKRYHWKPVRRVYIPKRNSTKKHALGLDLGTHISGLSPLSPPLLFPYLRN